MQCNHTRFLNMEIRLETRMLYFACGAMLTLLYGHSPVLGCHYTTPDSNTYAESIMPDNRIDTATYFVNEGEPTTFFCKTTEYNDVLVRDISMTWFLDDVEIPSTEIPADPVDVDPIHDYANYGPANVVFNSVLQMTLTPTSQLDLSELSCQLDYYTQYVYTWMGSSTSFLLLRVCSTSMEACSDQSNCAVMCDGNIDCNDGADEDGCELIDECASSPCLNGGRCLDELNSYTCACVPGFTNANCDTNIDECASSPCQYGGRCTDGVNSYTCACAPGYTNVNCDTDIDDCASRPCQNGGQCTDGVNSVTCACAPGYTDVNCGTELIACDSNPCRNGGSCVDGFNLRYTCQCLAGYTGDRCERASRKIGGTFAVIRIGGQNIAFSAPLVDQSSPEFQLLVNRLLRFLREIICDSVPGCSGLVITRVRPGSVLTDFEMELQSGSSTDAADVAAVVADTNGIIGDMEVDLARTQISDICDPACENGGTCTNPNVCQCIAELFTGEQCQTAICEPVCLNGGTCSAPNVCSCTTGYTGPQCQTDIDECALNMDNCQNDAVCINTDSSFTCECVFPCSDTDECALGIDLDICNPGGTCRNTVGAFTCVCNEGYTGDGTSPCVDIDECASGNDNCHVDATCTNTPGSFTCACNAGYSGDGTTACDAMCGLPCLNGGRCSATPGVCDCIDGFYGVQCISDTDDCTIGSNDDCDVDATCTRTAGSYTCVCNAGYNGDGTTYCDDTDECAIGAGICHTDATCTNTAGSFICSCNAGYTGDGMTSCLAICPLPCLNGGTCSAPDVCDCTEGYSGVQCQTEPSGISMAAIIIIIAMVIVFFLTIATILGCMAVKYRQQKQSTPTQVNQGGQFGLAYMLNERMQTRGVLQSQGYIGDGPLNGFIAPY